MPRSGEKHSWQKEQQNADIGAGTSVGCLRSRKKVSVN